MKKFNKIVLGKSILTQTHFASDNLSKEHQVLSNTTWMTSKKYAMNSIKKQILRMDTLHFANMFLSKILQKCICHQLK